MTHTHNDYTVAWISALPIEGTAAIACLDETHANLPSLTRDENAYIFGSIGGHNVVITWLPSGTYGTTSAARVAANLRRTFPSVQFAVLVGIGGGVPSADDIRLGDVVVGHPERQHGGVIQYDFGTNIQNKGFDQKGYLNKPPSLLSNAISRLRSKADLEGFQFHRHLESMLEKHPRLKDTMSRPKKDDLFQADYEHVEDTLDCINCDPRKLIARPERVDKSSKIVFGTIGSGNQVMRNATIRDQLYKKDNIKCFEMEAAGLIDDLPCIVIRGICDYADTHKNKGWQPYASAVAAAFAKELLTNVPAQSAMADQDILHHPTLSNSVDKNSKDSFQKEDKECLRDLLLTDPRDDKRRIESEKGGLLNDAYQWIKSHEKFKQWETNPETNLLWIKGDPGKGKTMLMCGIINQLKNTLCAWYFFQATNEQLSPAVCALRGIIFMLVIQQPGLMKYVRERYDIAGKTVFQDLNSWHALSAILGKILNDPITNGASILIDGLDECTSNRNQLLSSIASFARDTNSRWIVSSRNIPEIEEILYPLGEEIQLSLELNQQAVSDAVDKYISSKVNRLAVLKGYTEQMKAETVKYLKQHADDTFLWVALVCARLESVHRAKVSLSLQQFPPGLVPLYSRMMDVLTGSEDQRYLQQILAIVTSALRPLRLFELAVFMESSVSNDHDHIQELVKSCGAFLTMREDSVFLVHASAKDFILQQASDKIFPQGQSSTHSQMFQCSLEKLTNTLRRDLYSLREPYISRHDILKPSPDPLQAIRYYISSFADHLLEVKPCNEDTIKKLGQFLEKHFLHWLEAMSLCGQVIEAVIILKRLCKYFDTQKNHLNHTSLLEFVSDGVRFTSPFSSILEAYPLQIYCSALLFSPNKSIIRNTFINELPEWLKSRSSGNVNHWPKYTQAFTFVSDDGPVAAFSPDGSLLSVGDRYSTLKIWHVGSSTLHSEILNGTAIRLAFSADSTKALLSYWYSEVFIRLVDLSSNTTLWQHRTESEANLDNGMNYINPTALFSDGRRVAIGCGDGTIELWNTLENTCYQRAHLSPRAIVSLALSSCNTMLAYDQTPLFGRVSQIRICDAATLAVTHLLDSHPGAVHSLDFSTDGQYLGYSGGYDVGWIKLGSRKHSHLARQLREPKKYFHRSWPFTFHPHNNTIAIVDDKESSIVEVFDLETKACTHRMYFQYGLELIIWSYDGRTLLTATSEKAHTWDTEAEEIIFPAQTPKISQRTTQISKAMFLPNGRGLLCLTETDESYTYDIYQPQLPPITLGYQCQDIEDLCFGIDKVAMHHNGKSLRIVQTSPTPHCIVEHYLSTNLDGRPLFSSDEHQLFVGDEDGVLHSLTYEPEFQDRGWAVKAYKGFTSGWQFANHPTDNIVLSIAAQKMDVKFWAVHTGALLRTVVLSQGIRSPRGLAVTSDISELAIMEAAGFLTIHTIESGKETESATKYNKREILLYDSTAKYLHWGAIGWRIERDLRGNPLCLYSTKSDHLYCTRGGWIERSGRNLLWIPPDYGSAFDVHQDTVAIVHPDNQGLVLADIHLRFGQSYSSSEPCRRILNFDDTGSLASSRDTEESSVSEGTEELGVPEDLEESDASEAHDATSFGSLEPVAHGLADPDNRETNERIDLDTLVDISEHYMSNNFRVFFSDDS